MKPYSIARRSQEPFSVYLIGVNFVLVAYGVFFKLGFGYLWIFFVILCVERKCLLIGLLMDGVLCYINCGQFLKSLKDLCF